MTSVLVLGDTGMGKSYSLSTLIKAGIETFVVATEPNALETIQDAVRNNGLDINLLHYRTIAPAALSIATIMAKARIVNTKDAGSIQKMEVGLDKIKYRQYEEFLGTIADFKCERTGLSYGDVTEWDDTRAFVVDSLTGLNMMIIQYTAGNRPSMTQPEYGLAQNLERDILNVLCSLKCHFVLTAHLENAVDELTGQRRAFPISIGKALAPEIPRLFSEVPLAKREGSKFFWSTDDDKAVVKRRGLPSGSNLAPDFGLVVQAYNQRKEGLRNDNLAPQLAALAEPEDNQTDDKLETVEEVKKFPPATSRLRKNTRLTRELKQDRK